jgi:glycosyltransferase involved in cell wall biosynthesis
VVIPTRDRPEALECCLQAVQRLEAPPDEILVVDSAPQRFPAEQIAARYSARYFLETKPGASRARNLGAKESVGDVIAYLDDDSIPEPGWLSALMEEFSDPEVAAVTGRILPERTVTEAEQVFESLGALDAGEQYRKLDRAAPQWFELANFGGMPGGGNLAVRRSVFDSWPGFDERLGRGALQDCNEEPHAYLSLLERGHRVAYTPRSVVRHPSPSTAADLRSRYLRDMRWSAAYMTLLAVEFPRHRRAVLKYAWQGLLGKRREWRSRSTAARNRIAPRWRTMLEWMKGPFLYLRMRWRTREGK